MLPRARYLQSNIDSPGYLVVAGCEWHISPEGRSYFVNHNTRTTSWKKPIPERPAESLTPECIIDSDVPGLAWPESPGLGLASEGSGLVKPQARPYKRAWAWLGPGSGPGQGLLRPGLGPGLGAQARAYETKYEKLYSF